MAHHLNTNKQFMLGNGLLAFAIIFVVVLFVYMSFRLKQEKDEDKQRYYTEIYSINLVKGFAGDSLSVYINDSLLLNKRIAEEPFTFEVTRFEEQSALMIVDNSTDEMATFDLSEKGGIISLVKDTDGVKQLGN